MGAVELLGPRRVGANQASEAFEAWAHARRALGVPDEAVVSGAPAEPPTQAASDLLDATLLTVIGGAVRGALDAVGSAEPLVEAPPTRIGPVSFAELAAERRAASVTPAAVADPEPETPPEVGSREPVTPVARPAAALEEAVQAALARLDAEVAAARAESDAVVSAALEAASRAVQRAGDVRRERWAASCDVPVLAIAIDEVPPTSQSPIAPIPTPVREPLVPPVETDPEVGPAPEPTADDTDELVEIDLDAFLGWDTDDFDAPDDDRDPFERFWADVIEVPSMRDRLRRLVERVAL